MSDGLQIPSPGGPPRRGFRFPRIPRSLAVMRERVPRDAARFVWLTILPVGVALLSLGLSVYGLIVAREAPDIIMTMPGRVRLAQGEDTAWLYLQPRFVNTGDNQRNEVISNLVVEVQPATGGTPVAFGWDEQGTWLYNAQTNGLNWQYLADPAPLVVGPSDPQFPIGLFIATAGWVWQPGSYRVTVVAERTVRDEPLRASVELTLTTTDVDVVSDERRPIREVLTSPAAS